MHTLFRESERRAVHQRVCSGEVTSESRGGINEVSGWWKTEWVVGVYLADITSMKVPISYVMDNKIGSALHAYLNRRRIPSRRKRI